MNPLVFLFQEIVYRPLLNLLVLFYSLTSDFGISLLVLTLIIKIFFWPLDLKIFKIQKEQKKKIQEFQKSLKLIQKKYQYQPQLQNEKMLELVKSKKINPFASFLPMAVQVIVFIGIWQVLKTIIEPKGELLLYSFIPFIREISPTFLGILNLARPNAFLAILSGISQYFYSKFALISEGLNSSRKKMKFKEKKQAELQKVIQKQMTYFFPVFVTFLAWTFPSALPLYWIVSNLINIFQKKIFLLKSIQKSS